ncbi:sensor histidine kinase [Priestia megaterium]|uniref:Signal transduction histidine-protein kinase ArlS n=1 Tax=Priestia megaterium (strain DSM 319 / IMG 1521) TaxID=592022 RepID=D5DDR5_PRIM3|nr:ATP-binding protein [Priestia megaterium]ADF38616.1 two-component sensor histidine kinase [Priestia megaterium DSM 319]MED3944675.1 ATP-binding protein [Priestia megaterium]MED4219433.1 ATP-binding protein [Priestia megaterium]WEZ37811.1 ATP-binding protein [Priestia megaterium DSM 319]
MKITTKVNLFITVSLLLSLLIVNAIVFFLFMKTTVNMEAHLVSKNANAMLKKYPISESLTLDKNLLNSYMSTHSFIRIVGPDSKVIDQVSNDKTLAKKISPTFSSEKDFELRPFQEHQNLVVHVPIYQNQKVVGTLEISERLSGLESRKDIILSIMGTVTAISVLISFLAGRWLSAIIMKPIVSMISTMEDIEQSGTLKRISMETETKDEVYKMAATFNRMIGKLEENSNKQRQFISDASHELKTPLTIISSFITILRRHGTQDEKIAKEATEAIYLETNRMKNLTKTLLSLAELEDFENIEMQPLDLVSLCTTLVNQFRQVYDRPIILHKNSESVFIEGDELKLKQVIIIFLDNAIKYSTDVIEVFLENNQHKGIIRIKDYGIGIPEEDQPHVFERFYRVDKARKRDSGGSGLGLAIAKNIVSLHKGEINIQSKEHVGTEIKVVFSLKN